MQFLEHQYDIWFQSRDSLQIVWLKEEVKISVFFFFFWFLSSFKDIHKQERVSRYMEKLLQL